MKFTLSWLKDHLETEADAPRIAEALTALGLEVEGLSDPAARLAGFHVAEVAAAEAHPDADRLKLCTVDTGAGLIRVVCGASNARPGLKVALARPGTVIPSTGDVLKKGRIRGVDSEGMLCSARELELGEDHQGILELPADAPLGAPIDDVLALEPVFDVAVTPNRPDCLGVRGLARDLAAAGLGRLKEDPRPRPVPGAFPCPVGVRLDFPPEAEGACGLFVGRSIRGLRNGQSPQWLKDRLRAIGLRPISALVDITNFLTVDLGRPLHVFDADKLSGDVVARLARPGERLEALNDKSYDLTPDMVVIADQAGAQALGGVIGGTPTACTEETVAVFIESAWFDPRRISATGRALAIDSDARHRFERGVDPASCAPGMEAATRLIQELCGGEASDVVVAGTTPGPKTALGFRPARVAALGGLDVPAERSRAILEALGFSVEAAGDGDAMAVTPPSWRGDVEGEADLVEEVLRVIGYDSIPAVPVPRPPMPRPILTPEQRRDGFVRRELAARGLMEAVTWAFLPRSQAVLFGGGAPETLLANPISSDLDALRPSLLPNLIAAAGRNAARGLNDAALFEIGPVFTGGAPGEQAAVCAGLRAGLARARHWSEKPRPADVFDAKADALAVLAAAGAPAESAQVTADAPPWYHPGRAGCLRLGPKVLAWFGEIHPRVLGAMDVKAPVAAFEVLLDAVPRPKTRGSKAKPLLKTSPFQPVERDFAFVVDEAVRAETLLKAVLGADKTLIAKAEVFDVYSGEGLGANKKSLAVSVTLQPWTGTLTDGDIQAVSKKIVEAAARAAGAELRG